MSKPIRLAVIASLMFATTPISVKAQETIPLKIPSDVVSDFLLPKIVKSRQTIEVESRVIPIIPAHNAPQDTAIPQQYVTSSSVQNYARSVVDNVWGDSEWPAFNDIVNSESGWNPNALNRSSGACGFMQALPCSKIPNHSPEGQIDWGVGYIKGSYGSPSKAWAFHKLNSWY